MQIKPTECLAILDSAASQLSMPRADHAKCQQAVRTLESVVTEYERMKAVEAAGDLEKDYEEQPDS